MFGFRQWRRRRILRQHPPASADWADALTALPLLSGLSPSECRRLLELATLFLHEKAIEPAGGLKLDYRMRQMIALQAALPVLELGLDWYRGWVGVVVYPDEFLVNHEEMDEAGVVHQVREARSGESWERGPLVLSWSDVLLAGEADGYNVVLHELAHKLDALDGVVNGRPPLHPWMDSAGWAAVFQHAYDELTQRCEQGGPPLIDCYGAESPAEFFAVATEMFFERPHQLAAGLPELYEQLRQFYRQEPRKRHPADAWPTGSTIP